MEMLGRYKQTTALSNKNAGSCKWCFATYGDQEYFIKEFLEPKYPENDTVSSPEKRAKKIQKCEAFEQRKAKIYREINACSDGNATRVVDFFRVGTKYYMVMPRVKSVEIGTEAIAKFQDSVKRRICTIIAHAVAQLHKIQFVHADIKHTNVMFTHSRNNVLTAKLIDYDAGFFESDPPTHPEEIAGDQVYFSPEVWKAFLGEEMPFTCKMDVFALGILFHQYLTGEIPEYDTDAFSCVGEAVAMDGEVKVSADLPPELHSILCRMLEADINKRPDSLEVYHIFSGATPQNQPPAPPLIPISAPPLVSAPKPEPEFFGDAPARDGWWDMGDL